MSLALFAAALMAAPLAAGPVAASELAADSLAAGRAELALATLEKASMEEPHDAAVLINLGIAYAQAGDEARARAAFERALACHQVVELDTTSGATDSRRLARKAIKMLDRGEFRPGQTQLTYND